MSNMPKSFLELDDAPVKVAPNTSVFTNAQSLQPREGAVAKQDANGNWVNAIGLQSSASHRHVAKQWQAKCTPLADFIETVKSQSTNKVDVVKPESEIRLKDVDTLVDGTPLTDSGMNSLRVFADMPSSIISFLKEREYNDDLVKYMNAELDRRETLWNNKGKEKRTFNVRIRHDDEGNNVVRAIVSERYGVIDNHEAMEMVANALPSLTDALASHLFNDSDDIYGNILLPDYMKSEPDSDYGVGIAFKNSEIRNSTFKISPFLFRAICLNGMIWGRQDSNIPHPLIGRIVTPLLVDPVSVQYGEVHTLGDALLKHFPEGGERRTQPGCALVVPVAKLEAEIEQPVGIVGSVAHGVGIGQRMKRPIALDNRDGHVAGAEGEFIEIGGVGIETGKLHHPGVVMLDAGDDRC